MTTSNMILTRYLYPKHNVEYSLKIALFQENHEHALFWAYELYFSGFKQHVLRLLIKILDDYFASSLRKNKITKYLQKKTDGLRTQPKDSMVATFVENIIRCQINVEKLDQEFPDFQWEACSRNFVLQNETKLLYIVYRDQDIQTYKNRPFISSKSWKIPSKMCKYMCLREPSSTKLNIRDYDEWLFYAAGSPLWKSRIQKYDGMVDYEQKTVRFSDEDLEESFRNVYDFEPDEQPLIVQNRWFGQTHPEAKLPLELGWDQ